MSTVGKFVFAPAFPCHFYNNNDEVKDSGGGTKVSSLGSGVRHPGAKSQLFPAGILASCFNSVLLFLSL